MMQIDFLSLFELEQILQGLDMSTFPHAEHSIMSLWEDMNYIFIELLV